MGCVGTDKEGGVVGWWMVSGGNKTNETLYKYPRY